MLAAGEWAAASALSRADAPPMGAWKCESEVGAGCPGCTLAAGGCGHGLPGRFAECGEGTIACQFDERIHHLNKTVGADTNDDDTQSHP
jgi:hypothetical protein